MKELKHKLRNICIDNMDGSMDGFSKTVNEIERQTNVDRIVIKEAVYLLNGSIDRLHKCVDLILKNKTFQ